MTKYDPLIDVPEENRSRVRELLSQREHLDRRFDDLNHTYAGQEAYDPLFVEMGRVDQELLSLGYVRR